MRPFAPPSGTRVCTTDISCRRRRIAMVVGPIEPVRYGLNLLPVLVEGSTRREFWPVHLTEILPTDEQFKALGGQKKAPAGYPLIPVP